MKVTEFAIRRPVAMTMVVMFFVVLGLFGLTKIGADLFPKTNIPVVTIMTFYPGAGAQETENQVVDPIEEAVSSISGLKKTSTWINEGVVISALEFTLSTDSDTATMDVQKAVDAVQSKLPEDVEKPVVKKIDMNANAIVTMAVSGKRPLNEVYDITKDKIKSRLETLPGVAGIDILGGKQREILVELDRQRMEAYGLSANMVTQLLEAENLTIPGGKVKQSRLEYNVRLVGKFKNLHDIEELLIPLPTGSGVRLREIATVKDTFAEVDQYARLNKETAVGIMIQKQSDASIVDTAKVVREELEQLKKTLPGDIEIKITDDRSVFINNSLNDTKRTLVEGVIMTGVVLLFFLREWRSVFIVMVAIPTSIIATFMMMFFFGYTFNILSLMGLSLCVGILVDDSIVVLENIHRHMKMGKNPVQAAIDGRSEIGMAAIAITMSDVVVFGPIAFMQGMVGQMFRQFGLTVVVATLFSLFISFTLTPMMASRFYKEHKEGEPEPPRKQKNRVWAWVGEKTNRLGDLVVAFYRGLLKWSLQHRLKVLTVIMLAIFGSLTLTPAIGFEFMSKTDQGKFTVKMELAPGTALDITDREVARMEEKLNRVPEIESYFSNVGISGNGTFINKSSHLAKINVVLKPKSQRERNVWEVADDVRKWRDQFPGVEVQVQESPSPGMDNFEAPIIIEVTGPDYDGLAYYAEKVRQIVSETEGIKDVDTSYEKSGQPEYQVQINRDRAAELGFTTAEVAQALRTAMAGTEATKFKERDKEIDIRVRLSDVNRKSAEDIGDVTITNRFGQTFLVKQVADIVLADGPTVIRHKNRDRMINITANYKQGASLSSIVKSIEEKFAKLNMPPEYSIGYDGDIKQMQETNVDLFYVMALALILVYMILVILYESFLTPFIRMLALPCGLIGALGALFLTHNTLNMMSLIGIIMLEGLAAKNGTILIDYTNTLMDRGMTLRDALLEAGTTRLRPIFMTSVTMIFGMLPTAMAIADGAEIRKGMGIVLVGGLITSTILTPILIPVAYTLIDDLKHWGIRTVRRLRGKKETPSGAAL